jgi:hypothetical protein
LLPDDSIIDQICQKEETRKMILTELGIRGKMLVIGSDMNFNGTIHRAIELKSFKSI